MSTEKNRNTPKMPPPAPTSSQAGLSAMSTGASISGMRIPQRVPVPPQSAAPQPPQRNSPQSAAPLKPGPIIDRVPTQEELESGGAEQHGFEAQEDETTVSATTRGFAEGLSMSTRPLPGTREGAQSSTEGAKMTPAMKAVTEIGRDPQRGAAGSYVDRMQEKSEATGPDAIQSRLESRPWLREIVNESQQQPQDDTPQQDGGEIER